MELSPGFSPIMWPVFSCKWQWSRKKGGTHVPEQDFLAITPPYRLTATLCATDRLTATVGEKASAGVVPHRKERRGGTASICEKNSATCHEKSQGFPQLVRHVQP